MNESTPFRNKIRCESGAWAESNRRRVDFQSTVPPTELWDSITLSLWDLRFGTDQRRFAHEIRISNHARWLLFGRIASHEQSEAVDQASAAPVNELLIEAMQATLCA